jgi:hypothetical protein
MHINYEVHDQNIHVFIYDGESISIQSIPFSIDWLEESTNFHELFPYTYFFMLVRVSWKQTHVREQLPYLFSPAEKPTFLGEPSNVVYSFFLPIKWKLRISRFRICMMPPWHPWAFCAIQDGVQDGGQFKQTPRPPLLFNIKQWFWCQTLCF